MNSRKDRITWNKLFIEIAKLVAQRSEDPHTQVGAVIVKDNRVLSIGYNGPPKNFSYDFDWLSADKYAFTVHSEANALANAAHNGVNVDGADIYLTLSPCHECIKLLIQAGIKNVYYLSTYKDYDTTALIANSVKNINLVKINDD